MNPDIIISTAAAAIVSILTLGAILNEPVVWACIAALLALLCGAAAVGIIHVILTWRYHDDHR